jgi:peptide/nickel transport system permease protein
MLSYALRRALQGIGTLFGVATVVFVISRLSGDPAALMLPADATEEMLREFRESLGLDRPLPVQYAAFLGNLVQGDLGASIRSREDALAVVLAKMPATLSLALVSSVLGLLLAFLFGVGAQLIERRWMRTGILWVAMIRESIPVFWFGLMLIILFAVELQWLPSNGNETWLHYVLPSITLGTLQLALFMRLFNAAFSEAAGQDYVRTARAKGLLHRQIVLRHMLPNALLPVVTVAGVNLGALLTGTVVAEMVFSWPGMGRVVVDAVFERDFPVVQAGILVMAAIFVLVNLAVDLLYAWIDPRVRLR